MEVTHPSEQQRCYFIEDMPLAFGGQAMVFKGFDYKDREHKQPLAVKCYLGDRKKAAFLARQEYSLLDIFRNNPVVVNTVDYCDHPAQPYVVMEYVPETLADRIATDQQTGVNTVTQSLIMDFCFQMSHFFRSMHEQGLVHLDLTPHNIGYDERNRLIKVMDFGVALRSGTFRGIPTPGGWADYLSPEVRLKGVVTNTSDLYTMEKTLEELLLGRISTSDASVPNEKKEQAATAQALQEIEAVHNIKLPASFRELMLSMTAYSHRRPRPDMFHALTCQALRDIDKELYFRPLNHNRVRRADISSSFQTNPKRN